MNKKIIVLGIISMFLMSSNVAVSTISSLEIKTANANDDWDIIVDDDGGEDYTSIQEAIDNAWPGCRIFVKSGNYESIRLPVDIAGLTIHGENKTNTYIIGQEGDHYVVWIRYGSETNISGFTVMNGEYGIEYRGSYNIIAGNIVKENSYGGIHNHDKSSYNVITGNIVTENNNQWGGTGITIYGSYNEISDNIVTNHNDEGIGLDGRDITHHNIVTGNIIKNNEVGIGFLRDDADHNTISDNTISNNEYGIEIWAGGSYNNIFRNNITNNEYGIINGNDCHNNTFYYNNLINNDKNAYDDEKTDNLWDDGTGKGNYWDDYSGVDLNPRDGIGDSPYKIKDHDFDPSNNNVDRYPLKKPYPKVKTHTQNRAIQTPFLNFLENHPNMFPVLRQLLGL